MSDVDAVNVEDGAAALELPPRPRSLRLRIEDGWLVAIFGLFSAFYLWTATSGLLPLQFGGVQRDDYNELVDGILSGHLYTPIQPPPGLLALANPYDPHVNAAFASQVWDLALYHGHLYLAWGPTPVFTLLLPWRWLDVGQLDQNLACVIYCAVGLLFSSLLLRHLVRALIPGYRSWQLVAGYVALATGSVVPFLLRRTLSYEVAISCSYCFVALGLYLLAPHATGGRVRWWRTGLGSLSLGLAIGGHVDSILVGLVVLGALGLAALRERHRVGRRRTIARLSALVVPFALVFAIISIYNEARFGSPLQYGWSYQLSGSDQETTPTFQLGYLLPGLYYYLIAPARFLLAFPYFSLAPPPYYPGSVPAIYSPEIVGGIFTTAPISLAVLLGVPRIRQALRTRLGLVVIGLVVSALAIVLVLALGIWSATERYEVDYAPLLITAALLVWFAGTRGHSLKSRAGRVLGAAAIVVGSCTGLAFSITGYSNGLQIDHPATYAAIQSATTPLPQFISWLIGRPAITAVVSPDGDSYQVGYGDLGIGADMTFPISEVPTEISVIAGATGSHELTAYVQLRSGISLAQSVVVQIGSSMVAVPLAAGVLNVKVPLHGGQNSILISALPKGVSAGSSAVPVATLVNVVVR